MAATDWTCGICLYVPIVAELDDDAQADVATLTVIDGQMVCVRHAMHAAAGSHYHAVNAAVRRESGGDITGLSEYQNWVFSQKRAQEQKGA